MIMTAVDMVYRKGNELDDPTIRHELEGNLCRCTGYHNIVKAIAAGAKAMGQGGKLSRSAESSGAEASSSKETAMSATGIGASVRRKEDQRFITGKGHYTDDVSRPGQGYAYFLRSPHAHARIKSIDGKAAAAMPGVLAVLTGDRARCRQDRQPHLRLDDPFQGRLADEDGAAPGARARARPVMSAMRLRS